MMRMAMPVFYATQDGSFEKMTVHLSLDQVIPCSDGQRLDGFQPIFESGYNDDRQLGIVRPHAMEGFQIVAVGKIQIQ